MPTCRASCFLLLAFVAVAFAVFPQTVSAQLGEYAGRVDFSIAPGGSETLYMTIFNSGNKSMAFEVQAPYIKPVPNETTPAVAASPHNGTLQPGQNLRISITAVMPIDAARESRWGGVVQVIQVPNSTSTGGATVESGVAKTFTIDVAQPAISTTALPTTSLAAVPVAVTPQPNTDSSAIAVVGLAGAAYYLALRRRRTSDAV